MTCAAGAPEWIGRPRGRRTRQERPGRRNGGTTVRERSPIGRRTSGKWCPAASPGSPWERTHPHHFNGVQDLAGAGLQSLAIASSQSLHL